MKDFNDNICSRLFHEIENRHLKAIDLSRTLNINSGVVANWKRRNTDPPATYIPQIAEFLGVSEHYLLTGEELTEDPEVILQSMNEKLLLDIYRALPAEQKLELLSDAQSLISEIQKAVS